MHSSLLCTSILLWCFSLLLTYSSSTPSSAITNANQTDLLALLAIKSQLHMFPGVTSSWNNSIPLCQWYGVSCGHRHQRVSKLDLSNQRIQGRLSPYIGNLSFLRFLNLEGNSFYGAIPCTIPNNVSHCSSLIQILAYNNNLEGEIPADIGRLSKLEEIAIGENNLTGQLPTSIGNLSSLRSLVLRANRNLKLLNTLRLGSNSLTGNIPSSLGNLDHLNNLLALNISKNRFYGEIPATLGSCTSLEDLDIQGNSFSGSIPSSLSSLRSIKKLDLSFNNLSVPTQGVFSNTTIIFLRGNEKLCGGVTELHLPACHSKGSNKSKIKLLKVVIPIIVSCLVLSSCFLIIFARRRKSANKSSRMLHMEEQFPMVTYAELSKATNEFSSSHMIGASKSFMAECEALRNIRHRNLIKIITLCSSLDFKGADFKALFFQYMENGSLEEWLHHNKDELDMSNLSLVQRLDIAIDVASAIEYLHHHCQPPIIHGDLKPSNILLDHDMVAHVGDFGLAKFRSDHHHNTALETQTSSIGIKGTIGYVAPEYGMSSQPSMPGDVHSFGLLLLEMFTGRRPTDSLFINGLTLHEFASMAFPERVMEIVDPSLLLEVRASNNRVDNFARFGEGKVKIEECLVAVVRIGVLCSMKSPAERLDMTNVVAKLCSARENFLSRIN
ncbi:hypothetical protein ACOSQ3_025535 [Xanthoceras sorbifolium]